MMLNEVAAEIYQNNAEHGWYEHGLNFPEALALIHAEVSEVLEAWRRGREITKISYYSEHALTDHDTTAVTIKPDGIPIELADIIIRVLGVCGYYKIDIDAAIAEKMAFNKDRPHRHGNLRA